jgi:hypothetical protein
MAFETANFDITPPKIDINKTHIEKKIWDFENVEKASKEVKDIVFKDIQKEWISEYFPKWIDVKNIDKNIFLVIDNNTNKPYIFVDRKWDMLINIPIKYNETYIKNNENWNPWRAMLKSGFVFWPNKNWPNLELYKITWYNNWKLEVSWKIDTFWKEYYQAWKTIVYNQWLLEIKTALESDETEKYNHFWIEALLDSGAMKKEHLDKFKEKWIISDEDYKYWIDYINNKEKNDFINSAIDEINSRVKTKIAMITETQKYS